MTLPNIESVPIGKLRHNPYRNLDTYPWDEEKIGDLIKSYAEVGMWEGVIARPAGDNFEIPFAHHRIEAAKRAGYASVAVIVRPLTDEQMIKMMAHENSEDYSTNFIVQLNTWEGGIQYLQGIARYSAQNPEPLAIARLLGMTRADDRREQDRINEVAQACNAAHALITAGHMDRSDLAGLSVAAARELTQAMLSQMERIDKLAKVSQSPAESVKKAKGFVSKAGKSTAKRAKKGEVSTKSIRTEVNANAFTNAAKARKGNAPLPLLKAFADALCRSLSKILHDDYAAEKLDQVAKAVAQISLEEDRAAVRRVQFELVEVRKRADRWHTRITPVNEKLVPLKQLEDRA
jgi:hypothetical protein